ncbi:MAG: PHP domain-containing protein, partial [Thermomicrobiaceae bacterium]|nr:PHP domain-containing protein [Thermomicrobiaceae bacterium]
MTISTVDLHTHSTASDGTCRPADLVALAARRGVRFLGLTDHDTTAGLVEAVAAGQASGVTVVPGIELGIDVAAGELHMLGYFIDPGDARLQETLARLRAGRETRAARMVERLRA